MNNTNLVARVQKIALRSFVVASFALFSTMALAQQGTINNLVDASTAADRLSAHYPTVQADLSATSEKSADYAFESSRDEFTMHVYEDVQMGIDPAVSIQSRMDGVVSLTPGHTDRSVNPQGRGGSGSLTSPGAAPSTTLSDPIVLELIALLQQ